MIKNLLKPNWEPGLSIPQLPTKHLIDVGIKALVLDVDGTLLPRQELILHNSVKIWVKNSTFKETTIWVTPVCGRKLLYTSTTSIGV